MKRNYKEVQRAKEKEEIVSNLPCLYKDVDLLGFTAKNCLFILSDLRNECSQSLNSKTFVCILRQDTPILGKPNIFWISIASKLQSKRD